jgi:hypothetical protein
VHPQLWLGLERINLTDLNDIYQYADRLKATIGFYETAKVA